MFTGAAAGADQPAAPTAPKEDTAAPGEKEQLAELHRKLEDLERQIGSLSDRKDK